MLAQEYRCVRTAKSERVYTGADRAPGRLDPHQLLHRRDTKILEIDVGVQRLGMQRLRYGAMPDRQDRLDETGHARCRLQVADICFRRTDGQRPVARFALLADRFAERAAFRRVADDRAGAMRFEEVDPGGIDVEFGHRLFDEQALHLVRGKGNAVGMPVRIDTGPLDDRVDRIAVAKRIHQRLDDDDAASFAADISARVLAESPA